MRLPNNKFDVHISLPKILGVSCLATLVEKLSQLQTTTGAVELDCSNVTFVDPMGMAILAAALEPLDGRRRISMLWLSINITRYMDRMDFFNGMSIEGVDLPNNRTRHDQSSKLLEIKRVADTGQSEDVAHKLAETIVGKIIGRGQKPIEFNDSPDHHYIQHYKPLRYALSELMENALTHARREGAFNASVWVAAQYYEDRQTGGRVQVAVVDDGCGFLATLQNHEKLYSKTHAEAVRLALQAKVSWNRDMGPYGESVNEGVGLTTTVRIAKETGGAIHIVSGDAMYTDDGQNNTKRRGKTQALNGVWKGVAISASFACNKLPAIQINKLLPQNESSKALDSSGVFRFED